VKIAIGIAIALVGCALAAGAASQGLVDAMRGTTPIADETKPPLLPGGAENKDVRRTRAYSMQPPTIPHRVDGYQIDRAANRCLMCHARTRAEESQAVPIGVTHYMDRDGNVLADVSPRRYFCDQCHVAQMDMKPLVGNTFRDVDTLLKDASASAAPAKAVPAKAVKKK
jgi:nitrate reductase (cytochrome), electron transfer subunit